MPIKELPPDQRLEETEFTPAASPADVPGDEGDEVELSSIRLPGKGPTRSRAVGFALFDLNDVVGDEVEAIGGGQQSGGSAWLEVVVAVKQRDPRRRTQTRANCGPPTGLD